MRSLITTFLIAMISQAGVASTFVGNGGNASDVELQVTLLQIKKSLTSLENKYTDGRLCTCNESLEGHKVCDNLKALTPVQKNFCQIKLSESAPALLNLLNDAKGVQIIWTLESMQVGEKGGDREAEGVAVPSEQKIFLNRDQFSSLKDYERIYLVTHELGHLVKMDQRYLRDDEKIGPFKQNDGGRQFLNALGSAVAMKSLEVGSVEEYTPSLKRSNTYKPRWLTLSFGSESQRNDNSSFAIKKYSGFQIQYRYQLTPNWGVTGGFRQLKGSETFFEIANTESNLKLWNVKASYRLMPFSNPLSMWGQSHFIFAAGVEVGKAEMSINDSFTSEDDEAKLMSPVLSAHYYLPATNGFWIQAGALATAYNYEFSKIGFKSQSNQIYYEVGVGYGF